MRRKDREVLDETKIDEFIRNCDCCRIGFYDKENDEVYIVPLNFGYSNVNNKRVFYFHGAKVGRKIDLISKVTAAQLADVSARSGKKNRLNFKE